jgi:hypothetical protein
MGKPEKIKKKIFEILIFHMKKLRNNPYGYKLKDYFKRVFLSHIEKTQLFSCEYRVYILMCFKSHIEKIKHSSSIYVVNFDMG